ncbi:nucleolar protein 14 isoform X1 [Mustela putorius furo]|uniref:Nucleolar protein 14 isoform X1 n=1 Tax=Mustela putorius furo TaxID=9669 RepID=A0A8U0RU24_MUSPF|nr:nucleolar protein 14 isoform X1 [Mustela putorius furo]
MGKARLAAARTRGAGAPAGAQGGRARPNPNPFEVKVNRQKFPVLGRKARHAVGQPGVSRARAVHKRTQTLLKEYKERDKSNVFTDKRFGEYSSTMSPEEKMMKRFALEQQRQHEKKSIYNLNEDEELTHYGQSLADIEKHNDIVDSDSDTEERGTLSAELTAAHFGGGGGLLHKKTPQQQGEEGEKPRSRRELIEELIAKSKQEKRERQAQREGALELTEKLDQDWKEIQTLLTHRTPKSENRDKKERPKPDAYDMMVRELGFEMKAQPSNRMKSEEELAKEEQERLQQLEAARLRRMRGEDEGSEARKPKHLSADDLNDGFVLDKDDRRLLSYTDGKMSIEEEQSGEASDGESEEEQGEDLSEEDPENSSDPDGHSDLESDMDSEEDCGRPSGEPRQALGEGTTSIGHRAQEAARNQLPYTFAAPESYEELKSLLSGRTREEQLVVVERIQTCNHPSLAVGNKAKLEKLFGFLLEYIGDLATDDPPNLRVIDKLVVQLYNLCQMFPDSASDSIKFVLRDAMHEMEGAIEARGRAAFPGLDVLMYLKIAGMLFPTSDLWHPVVTPALVCMSQLLTKCPVLSLQDVVKGLFVCCVFLDYVSLSRRFIPELVNFLLGILYIASPNKCGRGYTLVHPFRASGKNSELLVVSDEEDKATWQRRGLSLHWAYRLKAQNKTEANHTSRAWVGRQLHVDVVYISPKPSGAKCPVGSAAVFRTMTLSAQGHGAAVLPNTTLLSCLAVCLALVKGCTQFYSSLPSFYAIVRPLRALLMEHLAGRSHPPELQELCQSALANLEEPEPRCRPLVCAKSKPEPLKLFTPRLVKVLEFGRKQGSSKQEQERRRLIHKHKREFKGAVREIRRDNQFLARMQLSETLERDAERKRKVKQLFNSLATQEGEWKALKRKKFKK